MNEETTRLWQGFLASKPTDDDYMKIACDRNCRHQFRELAANYLLAGDPTKKPTKKMLLALMECGSSNCQNKAQILLVDLYLYDLTEQELCAAALNSNAVKTAKYALQKGFKNPELLRRLVYGLEKNRDVQNEVAKVILGLPQEASADALLCVVRTCDGDVKNQAITKIMANPICNGFTTILQYGSQAQKEEAARQLLNDSENELIWVICHVESLNDQAWQKLKVKAPTPSQLAQVVVHAKNESVAKDAWNKLKESGSKDTLKDIIWSTSCIFRLEAAQLLIEHSDFNEDDAGLIGKCFPDLWETAKAKLDARATPGYFIKLMKIS